MAGANSVAAHVLQHRYLVTECIFVDGSAERTKVVVVANAFELTRLTVELESMLRRVADATDTEAGLNLV